MTFVLYGSEMWAQIEESRTRTETKGTGEKNFKKNIWTGILTNEWRKLHNHILEMQFQRPDVVKEITKRRLMWEGSMPGVSKGL